MGVSCAASPERQAHVTGILAVALVPAHSIISAELKGPRQFVRIRPEIFNFEPDSGPKLGQTKPKNIRHGTHEPAHNDGPISACFGDDPKLLNCEVAQPSHACIFVFAATSMS